MQIYRCLSRKSIETVLQRKSHLSGSAVEIQITIIRYGCPQRALNLASGINSCIVSVLFECSSSLWYQNNYWRGWCHPRSINSNSKTNITLRMCFRLKPVHSKEVSPASTMSNSSSFAELALNGSSCAVSWCHLGAVLHHLKH